MSKDKIEDLNVTNDGDVKGGALTKAEYEAQKAAASATTTTKTKTSTYTAPATTSPTKGTKLDPGARYAKQAPKA